jgi:hypothetical protein
MLGLTTELVACGGGVGYTFEEGTGGSGGSPTANSGGTSSGGNPFYQSSGGAIEMGTGGVPPYEEIECPYVPPPETEHDCDPLDSFAACHSDQSCLPYIVYPEREDGCGSPGYGELCWTAGTGRQGELCSYYGTGCQAGLMCVVGAAGGQRCALICVPGAENNCPAGLICGETDVRGYGVCY